MKRSTKRKIRLLGRRIVIGLVLLLLLVIGIDVLGGILKPPKITETGPSGNGESEISDTLDEGKLTIHFIDVGQGDCTLIQCDGEAMLIDGGSTDQSSMIYTYLKNQGISTLKYMIATHPDVDHIGGLSGALHAVRVKNAFCSVTTYGTKTFQSLKKYLNTQNVKLQVPKQGQKLTLGQARIVVLSDSKENEDTNNNSIVLRLEYGKTSFLFTGDAEWEEEKTILESGQKVKSTVLKVAHHGSSGSTSRDFLNSVDPDYAVISVGADNGYGHPTKQVLERLEKQRTTVYRTDLSGTIICESNGKKLSWSRGNVTGNQNGNSGGGYVTRSNPLTDDRADGADGAELETEGGLVIVDDTQASEDRDYILNNRSKKFHLPDCEGAKNISEKNKVDFCGLREDLIDMGYSPCGSCKP